MDRHRTLKCLTGKFLTGEILTGKLLTGAAATIVLLLPGPAAGLGQAATPLPESDVTRPCFLEPARWNEALDGPVPRCLASTSTSASTAKDSVVDTADIPERPWVVRS